MKSLQEIFPRGSKGFFKANYMKGTFTPNPKQNDVQSIVATRRGIMNKVETEYSMILEAMKRKGEILRWEFEGITLRFANVKYTPDFVVFCLSQHSVVISLPDPPVVGQTFSVKRESEPPLIKLIEVKGPFILGNRERAVERFRHAKTYWPEFTFEMHQRTKEGWKQLI